MSAFASHLFSFLDNLGGFESRPRCAVAVSGGVDSMALALLLSDWLTAHHGELTALIVDHGLRPESAEEARSVAFQLKSLGVVAHILTLSLQDTLTNVQSAARDARYHALEQWCRQHHVLHLFTAHHGDDQLETLMMRFIRGSGVQGLRAIESVSYLTHVRLLRPLLGFQKQDCMEYLLARGVSWVEDPTNVKPVYLRNRVRGWLPVLAKEGLSVQRGLTLVDNFKRSNDFIHDMLVQWMVAHVKISPAGYVQFARSALFHLHDELLFRIIKSVCCVVSGNAKDVRLEKIQYLANAMRTDKDNASYTLNGCLVLVDKLADNVIFLREIERVAEPVMLQCNMQNCWDNRFEVRCCDAAFHGRYVGVLGKSGVATLRKQGYHLPKLPVQLLRVFPAIYDSASLEELLCVPHMGYYSDVVAEKALCIAWSPLKGLAD